MTEEIYDLFNSINEAFEKFEQFTDELRHIENASRVVDKTISEDCTHAINSFEELWSDEMDYIYKEIKSLYDNSLDEALETSYVPGYSVLGSISVEPTDEEVVNGVSDVLIDSINSTYNNIKDFNSIKINLEDEEYDEMVPVIDSIIEDENNHIGKLQQLIDLINPGSSAEEGKQETIELLDNSDINESLDDKSVGSYYLSYYEEYPIYRTEEGGYYTSGCELVESEEYPSLEEAKEALDDMSAELVEDGFEKISDTFYINRSKYVGEDKFYTIESEQGSEEHNPGVYQ